MTPIVLKKYFLLHILIFSLFCGHAKANLHIRAELQGEKLAQSFDDFHENTSQIDLFEQLQQANNSEERFYVYILISLSYKRLQDYVNADRYLVLAQDVLKSTPEKRDMHFRYLFERAQLDFDILKFDESLTNIKKIQTNFADLISDQELAYLHINQGYLNLLNAQYGPAESFFLQAKNLLKQSYPCDLPLVNAKLIELYTLQNKAVEVQAEFDEGIDSAHSCDLLTYKRFLHYAMIKYFTHNQSYREAYQAFMTIDTINNVLGDCSNIQRLNQAEQNQYILQQNAMIELGDQKLKNRNLLIALYSGFIFLGFSVGTNLHYRNKRKRMKIRQEESKQFTEMLLSKIEDERHRISKDLHDEVGHNLLEIKWLLDSKESEKSLKVDHVINNIRQICKDLYPINFKELGLNIYLQDLTHNLQQHFPQNIIYKSDFNHRLPIKTELHIYRAVQEILSNILKYAQAHEISLQLKQWQDQLEITIQDDGIFFDYAQSIADAKSSFGLRNIQERIHILNGELQYVRNQKLNEVRIKIPILSDENLAG